jgi:Fe2+ transport system protein FeoA
VECLQFTPEEAENQACRLEHVVPDDAAERLAHFLGYPSASPRGKIIPVAGSQAPLSSFICLANLSAGEGGMVRQIGADPASRAFLAGQGIAPGTRLVVLASSQNGNLLVESAEGFSTHLAAALAQAIFLQPIHVD